jgi:hypothetical protein
VYHRTAKRDRDINPFCIMSGFIIVMSHSNIPPSLCNQRSLFGYLTI